MSRIEEDRLYRIWVVMRGRCRNPNHSEFHRYGARGITVCPEWESYAAFKDWAMHNGYADDLSIDRINNDLGYSPENCRWATVKEQSNNRRSNHLLTFNGETKTMTQWAEETGISRSAIKCRLRLGWSIEKTLTVKDGKAENTRKYEYQGEVHTLPEWSRILGIKLVTLRKRLDYSHYSVEEAFSSPVIERRYITNQGQTLTYTEWARKLGISKEYFTKLIDQRGLSIDDIAAMKRGEKVA